MLKDSVATESIYGFAPMAQQADVSPEEPIFVLTGSQLQDIISRAVLPLQAELQELKDIVALQGEKMATLEATQDLHAENQFIQLQLINDIRGHKKQTVNQEHRIEILRSLLAAHDGKMLTKEARKIMKMDKGAFSRLVDSMDEYVETKTYSLNRRQTILILKSRNR
jgi:hypothetical protein